jgi:hypothetical protein
VPAVELEKYRIAGDRRPSLPAGAIRIAMRDRVERFNVGVSLCLSDKGEPTTVKLIKPSVYDDANEKILADVRKWRFKPYLINGQAAPVCTACSSSTSWNSAPRLTENVVVERRACEPRQMGGDLGGRRRGEGQRGAGRPRR